MKTQMITAFLQRYVQINPDNVDEQMDDFGIDYIFIKQGFLCVRIGDEGYQYEDDGIWLPLESVTQLRALLK